MDEKLRAMFDEFADQHGGDVASPFTPGGAAAFDAWLREPMPGGPPDISRALARVYADRADLRDAFPDPGGQDHEALLAWVASSGVDEEPLLARLYRPVLTPDAADGTAEAGDNGVAGRLRQAVRRVISPGTGDEHGVSSELVAGLADEVGLASHRSVALAGGIAEITALLTHASDRSMYLALSELAQRHARIGPEPGELADDRGLTGCELRVFSQNGEDGVLAEILRRIGAPARYFVEFGIESGREGNCVFLADVAGWAGLFMEPGDEMYGRLADKYAAHPAVRTVRAEVSTTNIERLFSEAEVPFEPDVVSIDVDGQDYWLWQAIESYRPRVVVIEYNSSLDPRARLVQPDEPGREWGGTDYFGASLGALEYLAAEKGYRLVHTELSGVNAFFVRSDLDTDALPPAEQVARRGTPNYFQRGVRHPADDSGRRYLDLDTGRFVPGDRAPPWRTDTRSALASD